MGAGRIQTLAGLAGLAAAASVALAACGPKAGPATSDRVAGFAEADAAAAHRPSTATGVRRVVRMSFPL